jgi:hypothetical protein
MNLFGFDHEPTPYSDAHDCALYNLMKEYARTIQNVRDASAFPPSEQALLARQAFPHMHSEGRAITFLAMKEARACASIGDVRRTRPREKRLVISVLEISVLLFPGRTR